jgi:hypothetical protein
VSERERRIAANEAVHRSVNERIEDMNLAIGHLAGSMTVVCECGDAACTEQIDLTVPEYERIRAEPTLFVVRPGHEAPNVEEVVERHEGFDVVRKRGGVPAQIAIEQDPRD